MIKTKKLGKQTKKPGKQIWFIAQALFSLASFYAGLITIGDHYSKQIMSSELYNGLEPLGSAKFVAYLVKILIGLFCGIIAYYIWGKIIKKS